MLAIVSSNADDLRRPHGRQQNGLLQGDGFDPAGAQAFHDAVILFGRCKQDSYDGIAPGHRLDQAVLSLSIQLKSAIFHLSLYNHIWHDPGAEVWQTSAARPAITERFHWLPPIWRSHFRAHRLKLQNKNSACRR